MPSSRDSVRNALSFFCAAFFSFATTQAAALGLGRLVVHSNLDEQLNGQIELIAPKDHEIKTLKATLASREEFDIAGVDRPAHLFEIKYDVSRSPKGQHYIKLTTDRAVREPFLHLLVQVEWSGGRLIREYSVLLDPPQWVAGRPAEIDAPNETVIGEVTGAATATPVAPITPIPAEPLSTDPGAAPTDVAMNEAAGPLESLPPLDDPEPLPPLAGEKPVETAVMPPEQQQPKTSVAVAPTPEALPAPVGEIHEPMAAAPAEAPVAHVPTPQPVPRAAFSGQEYGPVHTGETLTGITGKLQYDKSLTSQQAMMAILRANPAAFFDNNVNNLKAGKILSIPSPEAVAAIPRDQAAREFRGQYDAWQEYKLKMAGASRPIHLADTERPAPEAAVSVEKGKKAPPAPQTPQNKTAAQGKAQPVDLLRIVRANLERDIPEDSTKTPGVETKKDGGKELTTLKDRVATLEEAIETKKLENKESRDRVGKLQEQAKNTERLIDLENKELAKSQKLAAEKQAADAKATQEKLAQEKAAQEKAAQEKAALDKVAQEKAAVAKQPDAAKPAPAVAPTKTAKPAVTPAPPVEESFLDGVVAIATDNAMNLALVLGVFVLGGAGMYALRRRRASREFSESILSNSSLSAEASIISDSTGQAAASDTSFLSDFSQGGMGNVHTDEVDPIAEAEVYLAYGRDEQAEEILKDAIVKDPARHELKGKLLEIYFQRNDTSAFETLAEELYAAVEGRGGKIWDKAEEMGRKLSPNNPMFRGGKPVAHATAATTLIVSQALDTQDGTPTGLLQTQESMASSTGLDFTKTTSSESGSGLDFSMNFDEPLPGSNETSSLDMPMDFTSTSKSTTSGYDMDFNLGEQGQSDSASNGLDLTAPESTASLGETDFNTASGSSIDFNPGSTVSSTQEFSANGGETSNGPGLPGWDETATKLDLAKAYIDMGDSEGARSILDEVIEEGNDSQKKQARELANQIAA